MKAEREHQAKKAGRVKKTSAGKSKPTATPSDATGRLARREKRARATEEDENRGDVPLSEVISLFQSEDTSDEEMEDDGARASADGLKPIATSRDQNGHCGQASKDAWDSRSKEDEDEDGMRLDDTNLTQWSNEQVEDEAPSQPTSGGQGGSSSTGGGMFSSIKLLSEEEIMHKVATNRTRKRQQEGGEAGRVEGATRPRLSHPIEEPSTTPEPCDGSGASQAEGQHSEPSNDATTKRPWCLIA